MSRAERRGTHPMMSARRMKVNELKQQVQHRQYEVDCGAVAEAFLARHTPCWYPAIDTGPVRSRSTRPGGPGTTRPNARSDGRSGGPHAQSS